MKKFVLVLLMVSTIICAFAGCAGAPAPTPDQSAEQASDQTPDITVMAADCYHSMFTFFVAEKSGNYTFTANNSDGIDWAVYLFDEEFSDAHRYIPQAAEPVLEGSGSATLGTTAIEAGQYVYIFCSVNAFTADEPDPSATLDVTVSE